MAGNRTQGCSYLFADVYYMAYIVTALCCIVICHSVLTLVIICRHKSLHTTTNILIASLKLGDVLMALTLSVIGIVYLPQVAQFLDSAATVDNFLIGAFASSLTMPTINFAFIAVDRYINIAHPFYYMSHMTKPRILKITIIAWLIAVVNMFIPLFMYKDDSYNNACILMNLPIWFMCVYTVIYHVLITIVFICYFKIALLAFHHKKAANIRRLPFQESGPNVLIENNRKAAMKSVKFFAIIFGTFAICTFIAGWSIGLTSVAHLPTYIYIPLLCLYLINAIAGFYVHVFMSKEYSRCLKQTFLDWEHYSC